MPKAAISNTEISPLIFETILIFNEYNFQYLLVVRSHTENTEVTKSQRNRRRQRRFQIFPKNFTCEAWKVHVK